MENMPVRKYESSHKIQRQSQVPPILVYIKERGIGNIDRTPTIGSEFYMLCLFCPTMT